jgi:hypothetical protein
MYKVEWIEKKLALFLNFYILILKLKIKFINFL